MRQASERSASAIPIDTAAVSDNFSPWLLAAVAIVAWIKFRPRRSQR
jgi:hypothetical protein